ncbi:MAG: NAD(P)/FAD-dependent oxidoreductase [Balneolaceae bacterium]
MTKTDSILPVLIIGGGPVGLFLAICLLKKGIDCKVLEKRQNPIPDSRSLGIHPVSLELFDKLGITKPFLEQGVKILRGFAMTEEKTLGEISFESGKKPHNYILACPQFYTEEILRNELIKLNPKALLTGAEFSDFKEDASEVMTSFRIDGALQQIKSHFLVGCDGKNSMVRQKASIHFSGKRYPDTYIMGDFEDTTQFGADAVVFLPKGGMIECFPLPNGMRRWVVKTEEYLSSPTKNDLAELVKKRIDYNLFEVESTMLSSFGVQHFMAESFVKNRIILAGDAAHVVSPIGGQGMNLGWLGAWELTNHLSASGDEKLHEYHSTHKKVVRKAARRAEINMVLGRSLPAVRNLVVKMMISAPFSRKTVKMFTMRDL